MYTINNHIFFLVYGILKENRSNAQFIIRHINGKILKKHRYIRYALGDKFIDIDTQQFYRLKWDDF